MPGPTSTPSSRNPVVQKAADDFVSKVAAATGLAPDVIKAWVKVEGAYAPNGTGHFNFLNLRAHGGTGYSGVPTSTSPGGFAQFATVDDAAKETAHWLNTMPNYAGIRQSTSLGPRSQLAAIAASPWDAGHYQGGRALTNAYASVTSKASNWLGTVISDVGGIITKGPIVGGAQAVGDLPGIGGLPGVQSVTSAVEAPGKIADEIGVVLAFAFNPHNWLRTGYIVGGGVLALLGLVLMAKSVGALNVVGPAAPELNLASAASKTAAASPYKTSREGIGRASYDKPGFEGVGRAPSRRRSASAPRAGEGIPF